MSKRERIDALEARVAALEASNTPGGLGDTPDNTPGGRCRHVGEPGCDDGRGTEVCRFIDCAFPVTQRRREVSRVIQPDPEPVPQWRALVDSWAQSGVMGAAEDPLAAVLWLLHRVALLQGVDHGEVADALARIVAVAEGQVSDGWKADPDDAGRPKGGVYDAEYLIYPLAWTTPGPGRRRVLGDRAARMLRSLLDGAS